eukprot:COSAG01_NODE_7470_length_3197_cov_27.989025_1_plen_174_part_00
MRAAPWRPDDPDRPAPGSRCRPRSRQRLRRRARGPETKGLVTKGPVSTISRKRVTQRKKVDLAGEGSAGRCSFCIAVSTATPRNTPSNQGARQIQPQSSRWKDQNRPKIHELSRPLREPRSHFREPVQGTWARGSRGSARALGSCGRGPAPRRALVLRDCTLSTRSCTTGGTG